MALDILKFEDLKDFFSGLVKELEKIAPYASALGIRREGCRVSVSSTQSSIQPEHPSQGVVVSLWNGGSFWEISDNSFQPGLLKEKAVQAARQAMAARPEQSRDLDPGPVARTDHVAVGPKDPLAIKLKRKLDYAREIQGKAARCDKRVSNAVAVVQDLVTEEVYVNRAKSMAQRLSRVEEALQVYVAGKGRTVPLWDGESWAGGYDKLGYCASRAQSLVADAVCLLDAPRLKPGFYDVVADPVWSGLLAHEAFGHGMETDMFLKQRAKAVEYMGKPVASEITTLYDDPSLPGMSGTFYFDHEGALASPTRIIDAGILKQGMTDLYSALYLGLDRSANGRRESWERKAYARMTNTFFGAGRSAPGEIFASVEDGMYLRYASNGMEDPKGWGIQCEGMWAQRILGGKLTREVFSPVIMTGFVPDILSSISMVGNDLRISGLGSCGKGHKEFLKNTMGGPHLKLRARLA